MDTPPKDYTGQNLSQTIYIAGSPTTNPQITIARAPYLLEIHTFDTLVKYTNPIKKVSDALFGATIGLFINLVAKLIGSKIDTSIPFDKWEVYACALSLALLLICQAITYFIPGSRVKLIKEINTHFQRTS